MSHKRSFGCLMAYLDQSSSSKVLAVGNKIISTDSLYEVPGEDYGRETVPHVTIKYGFSNDLSEDEIKKIIGDQKKFFVYAEGLSTFNNDVFQVVKFDIKLQEPLISLRKKCDKFPNEDSHPDFCPHLTLAYTKKHSFTYKKTGLSIPFLINKFVYSPINGKKRNYEL